MKVDQLKGVELNKWVFKSQGLTEGLALYRAQRPRDWSESCNWSFIGPIIERDKIRLMNLDGQWIGVSVKDVARDVVEATGGTALEAVKRCIVKCKFGDEVTTRCLTN